MFTQSKTAARGCGRSITRQAAGYPPVLVPLSVVPLVGWGNWLVDVLSSVLFCALNGHADAAPAKASSVTKLKTNVRTMIRPSA